MRITDSSNIPPISYTPESCALPEKRRSRHPQKDTLQTTNNATCCGCLSTLISSIYRCIISPFKYVASLFSTKTAKKPTAPEKPHRHRRRHRSKGSSRSSKSSSSSSGTSYSTKYPENTPLVGICNNGNNCCFNAFLGGAAHIPRWRAAFENIDVFAAFFAAYDEALARRDPIDPGVVNNIREFFTSHVEPGYRWNKGDQEDTTDIVRKIFSFVCQNDRNLYPGLELSRTIQEDHGNLGIVNMIIVTPEPFIQLQRNGEGENFYDLVLHAVKGASGNYFEQAPHDILIDTKPYMQYEKSLGHYIDQKLTEPMTGEIMTLTLQDHPAVLYTCDYFVTHIGSSVKSGHYTHTRQINGAWYEVNDHDLLKITPEQAQTALSKATLIHYVQA